MKKFLSSIIILIALIGFSFPAIKVLADDPSGTCTYYDSNGNVTSTDTNSTQSQCAGTSGSDGVFTPDQMGKCIVNGVTQSGDWNKASCIQSSGVFEGYYTFLQPLPGVGATFNPISVAGQSSTSLSSYLNPMITVFIGICAVLAVIMILMGGIEYMTSELISSKEAGKERIRNALLGLVLALGAWTILHTINPNLLNSDINAPDVNVTVGITQAQQIANFTGSGTCTPVTSSSSACSPANLTSYGFVGGATEASSICNGESGGNANQLSGVDLDKNGKPFSFGLFQVNAVANANNIKASDGSYPCKGAFQTDGVGAQGSCLQYDSKTGKVCIQRNAWIANQTIYNNCQAYLLTPDNNITYAASLLDNTSWNSWGANTSCHF